MKEEAKFHCKNVDKACLTSAVSSPSASYTS